MPLKGCWFKVREWKLLYILLFAELCFNSSVYAQKKIKDIVVPTQIKGHPPSFSATPRAKLMGKVGQSLRFKVQVQDPKNNKNSKTRILWLYNESPICQGETCEINVDGIKVSPGYGKLRIIATNRAGSVQSIHRIRITGRPKKNIKKYKVVNIVSRKIKPTVYTFKENQSWIRANRSQGIYLNSSDSFKIVGSSPQNIPWEGVLKGKGKSVLQLKGSDEKEFFVLKNSLGYLRGGKENPHFHFSRGHVRARSKKPDTNPKGKLILSTPEAEVYSQGVTDIYMARISPIKKKKNKKPDKLDPLAAKQFTMFSTRIVVLSGKAIVHVNRKGSAPQVLSFPAGLEMRIYEDGFTSPVQAPKAKIVEAILKLTTTPEEVMTLRLKQEAAKKLDLPSVLKEAKVLIDNEDFFTALEKLEPLTLRTKESARIPLYLGMTRKGLYQLVAAEKLLKQARTKDKSLYLAPWHLALMKMEDKKWAPALTYFEDAEPYIPDETVHSAEVNYYKGVTHFQLGNHFSSKNSFTYALWEDSLNFQLKQSSAKFLESIHKQKPWLLVINETVGYDTNILKLTEDQDLPEGFPQRDVFNSVTAVIFSWKQSEKNGEELRTIQQEYGAKAIAIINLTTGFSSLDAYVFEFTPVQHLPKQKAKITEKVNLLMADGKPTSLTFGVEGAAFSAKLGVNYEHDLLFEEGAEDASGVNKSNIKLNAGYDLIIPGIIGGVLSLGTEATGKFALETSENSSTTYTASLNTGLNWTPATRLSLGLSIPFKYSLVIPSSEAPDDAESSNTIDVSGSSTINYFIAPWLTSGISGGYSLQKSSDQDELVNGITFSISLTGIF